MAILASHKKESSNHFEAFFEYATIGIVVTDSAGKITAINPYALKEFGYSKKELIGEKVEILVPSRFQPKHALYHQKFIEKPETRIMGANQDLFATKKDGTEFSVEISLSNYHLNNEKYVISFINNISKRKKAEAEIEKLHNQLEEEVEKRTSELTSTLQQLEITNEKLEVAISFQKALLQNAGAMIIATDEKGIIEIFNQEAVEKIGYKEWEVIDKKSPLIFHIKEELEIKRATILKELGIIINDDFNILVEKARRNIHKEEQYTYIRKNGTTFPVLLTINAIRNSAGEITGFMGIAIDISDRKKAEEDLLESLKKEKELNELKSRFVSMASHEFRTPLSTVLSSAYLIERYSTTDDQLKREKHLQRIFSSVNMLTDILNDFLSVGKIEEGKIQVRLSQFNIQEMINEIKEEMKANLKKHQKIRYRHEGKTEVLLDVSLMKHIILNLVSNASKFSLETSLIEIKTTCCNNYYTLSIKDNGLGISKEDQQHLMERFYRGTNAAHIQGTGLGLHIIAKYAELMNGAVTCISELEKGTEFIIKFKTKMC